MSLFGPKYQGADIRSEDGTRWQDASESGLRVVVREQRAEIRRLERELRKLRRELAEAKTAKVLPMHRKAI